MSNKPNNKGPIAQIKITRVSWYKNRYYKDRYATYFFIYFDYTCMFAF
jgi:hypothetical protein